MGGRRQDPRQEVMDVSWRKSGATGEATLRLLAGSHHSPQVLQHIRLRLLEVHVASFLITLAPANFVLVFFHYVITGFPHAIALDLPYFTSRRLGWIIFPSLSCSSH